MPGLSERVNRQLSDRLLRAPVFVLSSVRSGSTLLRLIMNSHPQLCAPHETHFRRLDPGTNGC